ncbi:MAG: hypothetical protein QXX99_05770 [Candidatus Bathyarchaeia archaeon]
MKKIVERGPSREIMKIIDGLQRLGFNTHLLTCEKIVLKKLNTLSMREVKSIREMFLAYRHPRLVKALCVCDPYGEKWVYRD